MKTIISSVKNFLKVLVFLSFFCLFTESAICNSLVQSGSQEIQSDLARAIEIAKPSIISIYVEGYNYVKKKKVDTEEDAYNVVQQDLKNRTFNSNRVCDSEDENDDDDVTSITVKKKFKILGSGVIIDSKKGYAVTNRHVVADASKIYIKTDDEECYTAEVVGEDKCTDLAVIRILDASDLHAIKIASVEDLKVGNYSIAIGNPYGFSNTSTVGIVSAIGRNNLKMNDYEDFIQTDAAINGGNSGGALINLRGELIGINAANYSSDKGASTGIGFAIPSNAVKIVSEELILHGQFKRGSIGIEGVSLDKVFSDSLGIKTDKGVYITSIEEGSSAEKSGIKIGDVILSLNNKSINSFDAFKSELLLIEAGSKIQLELMRNNKKFIFYTKVESPQVVQEDENTITLKKLLPGITIEKCKDENSKETFLTVSKIDAESFAEISGFKTDDVLISINGNRISDFDDLKCQLEQGYIVSTVKVERDGRDMYVIVDYRLKS